MKNRFFLVLMLLGVVTPASADMILTSGSQVGNAAVQGFLADMGHTVTHVADSSFGSAPAFSGFDAIYLDWISNFNGLAARKAELLTWVANGGNLLAEITISSGNSVTDYPFGEELGLGGSHADDVRIVDASHDLMTGLTDAGLSNWGNSHHGHYISDIGSFTGVADTGVANQWTVIHKTHGLGNITYISLDPSFHIVNGAGPTGASSQKGILIDNALTLAPAVAPVPEPGSFAIFGLLMGCAAVRRRSRKKGLAAA